MKPTDITERGLRYIIAEPNDDSAARHCHRELDR